MRTPWTGCGTALVTPFTREGAVDEAGVRRLARRQIEAGIHFLVPCGTTGESPDADRRRTRPRRAARRRGSRGQGPGAGRRGWIRHEGGHPFRQAHEAGGRRRNPVGDAVLQQADAGGPLPALQRDCRRGRPADRCLQRAWPDRMQRRRRHARPAQRRAGHRRREGSVRQHLRRWSRCAAPCRRIFSCCRATMR